MDWLKRALLNNWWLKLLSLALAYGLWAIVSQSPVVEIGVSVPLELRHVPPHLQVVGEIPPRVHVQLRGPENRLRALPAGAVGVVVDLGQGSVGNHAIELKPEHVQRPLGVEVVRIVPAELRLELAPR